MVLSAIWDKKKLLKKYTGQEQNGYTRIFVIVKLRFINATLKEKKDEYGLIQSEIKYRITLFGLLIDSKYLSLWP